MKDRLFRRTFMLLMLCFAVIVSGGLLIGCAGSDGSNGANGTNGKDLTVGTVDAARFTFDDLRNVALGGKILSVDTAGNKPVVTFQVYNKNTMEGIAGLRTFSLHIAQLKPETVTATGAFASNSYWMNYITTSSSGNAGTFRPATDPVSSFNTADGTMFRQGYSVVDNLDGTYIVTFGSDIKSNVTATFPSRTGTAYYSSASATYDPTLTHRVVVGVRGVDVPGVVGKTPGAYAGPINPITGLPVAAFTNTNGANLIMDFVPSTGAVLTTSARDIVTIAACNKCHYKIEYGFPLGNNTSGHFGSRPDTRTCVVCHTPQNDTSAAYTNADFTPFIHKIHMGEELPVAESWSPGTSSEIAFEVAYPQDIRKCNMCHAGVDGANWNTKPTVKACGSCHNNVNFTTGANHLGGARADGTCVGCHSATDIQGYHAPVLAVPNSNIPTINAYYANNGSLPTGAFKIGYVISSVTVSTDRTVSVKFQVTNDGTAVNFGTYNASTNPNIIPNTWGGPSLRIAYNLDQDGKTPADTNAYMSMPSIGMSAYSVPSTTTPPGTWTAPSTASNLWVQGSILSSGITWTLSGPDASNTYTVSSSLPLPASTNIVTAIMYGSMTETNVTGYPYVNTGIGDFSTYTSGTTTITTNYVLKQSGLIVGPANAVKSVTTTGFTARRTIVDNAKCNACHDQLGIKPLFHGGGRNDGTDCHICHTPNGNNGGWSYGANTFVHAIHGAAKRTKAYTFQGDWSGVGYPGLLKNCEQCHISGTYDFTASASSAAVSKLLYDTVATGTIATTTTSPAPAGTYGSGFAYSTTTGTVITTPAASTTLVSSPIAAACYACHDSSTAKSHMVDNGGSIYEARSTALLKTESCLVCHGPASNTAFGDYVPAIKAVHRWW